MIEYIFLIVLLLVAAFMVYLYFNQEKIEKNMAAGKKETDAAMARQQEYFVRVQQAMQDEIYSYKSTTPLAMVNKKNEAIILMPDGKTEIYNYDLKKKK